MIFLAKKFHQKINCVAPSKLCSMHACKQEIFAIQIETFCNDVQSTSFSIGFTSAGLINDKLLLWNIKLQLSSCLLGSVAQLEQIFQLLPYGGHPVLTSAAVQEDACSYMHFTEVPSFSLPDAPASTTAQHVKKKRGRPANSGVSQKLPQQDQCIPCKTKMGDAC